MELKLTLNQVLVLFKCTFDYTTLEHRIRELAFLNSGVYIDLIDHRESDQKMSFFMKEV